MIVIGTYAAANRTPASVFALVGRLLHRARDQAVRAEQMPLEALIGEEPELALLAVERWSIVDHLRMNLKTKQNNGEPTARIKNGIHQERELSREYRTFTLCIHCM